MIEGCSEGFSIRMSRWGMFEFVLYKCLSTYYMINVKNCVAQEKGCRLFGAKVWVGVGRICAFSFADARHP